MEEVSKGWPEARSVKHRSAGSWRTGGVVRQEVKRGPGQAQEVGKMKKALRRVGEERECTQRPTCERQRKTIGSNHGFCERV